MTKNGTDDLNDAIAAVGRTVGALKLAGVGNLAIASALFNAAGIIWRAHFPDEKTRERVITHAAKVAHTGKTQ